MTEIYNELGDLLGHVSQHGPPLRHLAVGYNNLYAMTDLGFHETFEDAEHTVRKWHDE